MSDEVVRFRGVTKRFGDFVAVGDLDFTVRTGVVYGILGPNGAGKTTALRMVNDVLAPDQGSIEVFGGLSPGPAAARRIGYLPEERGLYPRMRVADVLLFFGELRGLGRREAARRLDELLDRLGIADWRGHRVQDLSKGMQQKVQFAAALIHAPDLLILDEPWSGLDPINADVLREIVREQRTAGKTILFSTHLMEQAEQICDEICIIARGKKILDGGLEAVTRGAAGDRQISIVPADAAARERAAGVLADPALVAGRRERGERIVVDLGDGVTPAALLARLVGGGVELRRFEIVQPTLHEIFVARVGAGASTAIEGRRG